MPQQVPIPPPGFDDLTVDEQIDYVGALWDRIAADPGRGPAPGWHREVLAQRRASTEADGDKTRDWAEVRDELLKEFGGV
jgi:putative addiction module component (TIGR02574 family)